MEIAVAPVGGHLAPAGIGIVLGPHGAKQLTESLPTVVNGLKSGKVSPIKAIHHPKLPDQKQVRRIIKEIESKDERLELNLYIVGEQAEETE